MSGADTIDNGDVGAWAGGWKVRTASGIIVLAALAAYWNSFDGVFLYDDFKSIRDNRHIRKLWPLSQALSMPMWGSGHTVDRRPVLSFSLALNHALLGPEPWGYHVGNLAIHVLAALVLFGIVRRTLVRADPPGARGFMSTALALAVSALWAVHPLQTAAVTYLAQRAESLMGLFFLLTLYCAIRGFHASRALPWYATAVLACALGMASKEVMFAAPVIVLLYDRTFVSGSFRLSLSKRRWLYVALAATWLVLASLILATLADASKDFVDRSPLAYALTQPGVILYYLWLSAWPSPLAPDYYWPLARGAAEIVPLGLVVAAMLILTVWATARRRWLGFLGAWFFLILGPSSSFAAQGVGQRVQDHRMYLSLAAVIAAVVVGGYRLMKPLGSRFGGARARHRIAAALVLAVAAVFGYLTYHRNKDYHSELAFWGDNVRTQPGSAVAHFNLGDALRREGRLVDAMEAWKHALGCFNWDRISTLSRWQVHNNLGNCYLVLGRTNIALEHLAKADVYVFPSLAEGCASSGMEAMAAGLPVITTRESGLPIRHGENGWLIASKSEQAISDAIICLA